MIDFLKYRPWSILFSVLLLSTFVGTYIYNTVQYGSAFNYSVDFTGGTQVLAEFKKPVSGAQINTILDSIYQGVVTREFSNKEFIIRIKQVSADVKELGENVKSLLQDNLPDNDVTIKQIDSVSGGMGKLLRKNSFYAIIISLLLMLVYIAVRFRSFAFATGALVSLFHDALVILTYFLLSYKEVDINVIGAILVVLGYSINDTIVIFSKIRENIKKLPQTSIKQIVNLSLNQTLGRTIKTSFATALVVIALLLFGGQVLRGLSVSLLIGMIFGTYSSIYMASPVMLALYRGSRAGQAQRT